MAKRYGCDRYFREMTGRQMHWLDGSDGKGRCQGGQHKRWWP